MLKELFRNFDKVNAWVAAAVWLFILGIYAHTAAPTVSFWDCGEFIATSAILGVPHPPGSPLFTLFGRLFSILPIYADIAARINFFSALCSSIAALFGYLVSVRILRLWYGSDNSFFSRLFIYGGAACGALLLAFGKTQWSNSIEAEVYALAMLMFFAIFWLALIYRQHQETYTGDRVLILISFLTFLGIGVHMTTFLIMPAAAVMLVLKKNTPARVWYIVSAFFALELYFIFALSHHSFDTPFYVPLLMVLGVYVLYALSFERLSRDVAIIGLGLALSCLPVLGLFRPGFAMVFAIISGVSLAALVGYALWMLAAWIKARRHGQTPGHERIVPAVFVFVALLMSGVLLMDLYDFNSFVALTSIVLLGIALMIWRHLNIPLLIAIIGTSLIIIGVMPFIWGMVAAAAAILVIGFVFKGERWQTALMVVVMAFVGFSIHLSIPIRASQHPYINENNPSDFKTLVSYLERKQYGSVSMIDRMFQRRGEWANQFGNFRRMGLWGFFSEQFGVNGTKFLSLFILGVFGVWEITRRRPEAGAFVTVLLLLCTVGLVLYMNFADGTTYKAGINMDWTEVRDRDYFWTPGFMIFGLAIGIGAAMLIQVLRDSVRAFSALPKQVILWSSSVVFLLPVLALAVNYHENDRSRNYIAYDYGYNLLSTADKNAILFTAGDNDTFPLWALQQAYGIRPDVINVNLSLANTDWYVRHVRDRFGVKIRWTDDETRALRPFRTPDGRSMEIQDQVVDEIIEQNASRVPINFSATCSTEERQYQGRNIDSILTFSGFMFRLKRAPSEPNFDLDATWAWVSNPATFRCRGWADSTIYKDDVTVRTIGNLAGSFTLVSDSLRKAGQKDRAEQVLKTAQSIFPYDAGVSEQLAFALLDRNDTASIRNLIRETQADNAQRLTVLLARAYRKCNDKPGAIKILDSMLAADPKYRGTFDEFMRIYVEAKDVAGIKSAMSRWLAANPSDAQVADAYKQLQSGWSPFDSTQKKK